MEAEIKVCKYDIGDHTFGCHAVFFAFILFRPFIYFQNIDRNSTCRQFVVNEDESDQELLLQHKILLSLPQNLDSPYYEHET